MVRRTLCLAAASLTALVPAQAASASGGLSGRIASILRRDGFAGPRTGVAVIDVATGQTLARVHAWRRLAPASNEKLFVTVTALTTLHAGYRWQTRVLAAGPLESGVLHGDLYLVGGGDPTLTRTDVRALAARVRAAGIRRITGHVVGDESVFDGDRYGPSWLPSFRGIESPPLSGLVVDRDTTPSGHVVASPARHAAGVLRRALLRRGVEVATLLPATGRAPAGAALVARHLSRPLWRVLRFMNRESDNFTAETVLKTIGAAGAGRGTTADGLAVVRSTIAPLLGADYDLLHLVDGSGLSYDDRATASAIALTLARAADDPQVGPALFSSLSIAGVNGTLEHRLLQPGVRGRVRGKTGTLDIASALSGYATGPDGRRLAFSVLMNGSPVSWRAHVAQDAIASLLARRG